MMEKHKRRIINLIEYYVNEFHQDSVQTVYGAGSKIRIHNISFSTNSNSLMLEVVIILGELINEEVMDRQLADILVQDAMIYFNPDVTIKTYVRFDV